MFPSYDLHVYLNIPHHLNYLNIPHLRIYSNVPHSPCLLECPPFPMPTRMLRIPNPHGNSHHITISYSAYTTDRNSCNPGLISSIPRSAHDLWSERYEEAICKGAMLRDEVICIKLQSSLTCNLKDIKK